LVCQHFSRRRAKKKKLIEAGKYWVNGSIPAADNSELIADSERFGLDMASRQALLASVTPSKQEDFVLLPENVDAWLLFCDCATQWRPNNSGIDYQALISVIKLKHRKNHKQYFDDVRAIESGVLTAMKDVRNRHAKRV
jgi:hypothetical protein